MVAEATMMPDNPDEKSTIRRLLDNDPNLRLLVRRISDHADALFPGASLSLSTKQYDEWDPPLSLHIVAHFKDREDFSRGDRQFVSWLANEAGYDPNRLLVMLLPSIANRDVAS